MEKHYSQLIMFFYTAHFRSFTKAATHLGCSKAYVSKQMSELERTMGTPLFHRNTRMVRLTLAGESIFEHTALIVHEFQQVENTMASLQNKAQGLLRITSPAGYADCLLAPNLPQFFNDYPNITLEMNFTGQVLNLVDQKIDLAIRLTHEPPLERVAKRLGDYGMIICASPQYLKKHTEPRTPQQLTDKECLIYSTEKNARHWPFLVEKQLIAIDVKSKLSANSSNVLLEAALQGIGIARLPSYVVAKAIQNKELVPILTDFYPIPIPIYAIYAQSRIISPKIHVFLEFMQTIHRNNNFSDNFDSKSIK